MKFPAMEGLVGNEGSLREHQGLTCDRFDARARAETGPEWAAGGAAARDGGDEVGV